MLAACNRIVPHNLFIYFRLRSSLTNILCNCWMQGKMIRIQIQIQIQIQSQSQVIAVFYAASQEEQIICKSLSLQDIPTYDIPHCIIWSPAFSLYIALSGIIGALLFPKISHDANFVRIRIKKPSQLVLFTSTLHNATLRSTPHCIWHNITTDSTLYCTTLYYT